jgi:hypothetical protein
MEFFSPDFLVGENGSLISQRSERNRNRFLSCRIFPPREEDRCQAQLAFKTNP